jgi:hypothetical protein
MRSARHLESLPCEVPSLGSIILIGLVMLLALALAFSAGERSGYAAGQFDAQDDSKWTDQALYGHGGYELPEAK